jgi:archaellum biogenesis ATPase FlaH
MTSQNQQKKEKTREEIEFQAKEKAIYENEVEEQTRKNQKKTKDRQLVAAATKEFFDDLWTSTDISFRKDYLARHNAHSNAVIKAVPYICPIFNKFFKLTPGELMTTAAYLGTGKSTNSVNAAASAIKAGKRVVILSNEESAKSYIDKVACLLLGIDHKRFSGRTTSAAEEKGVMAMVLKLRQDRSFICLDHENTNGGTTKDDYILTAMQLMAEATFKPDLVIIDYLTNIYAIGSNGMDSQYFQIGKFLSELKNLINVLPFAVIMCAQMHSIDKRKSQSGRPPALDTRMVMGADILRYSTIVIEITADFAQKITNFTVHKNRTYNELGTFSLKYDKGLYREFTSEELIGQNKETRDGAEHD